MFERYTEKARRTLFFARYEASQGGSDSIEPEHLLLGLLRGKTALVRTIFTRAGLSYDEGLAHIRAAAREKIPPAVEIPFSPATKRILQYAMQEADDFDHTAIGSEHLLLGVLRENDSVAAALLKSHGLTLDHVRETIRQLLAEGVQPSWHAPDQRVPPVLRGEFITVGDTIEAIKEAIKDIVRQFGSHAKPGAQDVIARIVRDLDELKRYFS